MREGGGNCLKYLKGGWNRTEERGHKDFKRRGQAGARWWGGLKKGAGAGTPFSLVCNVSKIQIGRYILTSKIDGMKLR